MINEIEARKKLDILYTLLSLYKRDNLTLLGFLQFMELIRYFLGSENRLELYANSTVDNIDTDIMLYEFISINTSKLIRNIMIGTVKDCNDAFKNKYLFII